jgi:Protein kinase domain
VLEELQPGDPVRIGPYQLAGVLGAGGMGRVFLGWSSGGRPVAVKVIKSELAADPEFRARFRREVAAARAISGLYTALLVDTDPDAPLPWLATAYVDGPSLNEAVTSYGALPVKSVLALAAGLAEALASVHMMGLIHRDLKPSNVLLASDGPRVIDFGISRAADTTTMTSSGQPIGSPGYLSPEQAVGGEVGPPSDIFSLGAVLAFAASGKGPFGTGSLPALVYRVVHEPPALDGVPAQLRPLIERCLAKEPGDRPTASELLAELDGAQAGAQTGAAQWLPARLAAALAGFAAPAPAGTASGATAYDGTTAASVPRPGKTPPPAAPADAMPPPARPAAASAAGGGVARRSPLLRRGLLVPGASAVAVLAAVAALAVSLGGGSTGSVSSLAAARTPGASASGTPSPRRSQRATPTARPTPSADAKKVTATPAAPSQAAPTVVIVTEPAPKRATAAPKPSPTVATSAAGPACTFVIHGAASCNSTNPQVSLFVNFPVNTSGCTYERDITWGDGTSSQVAVSGGPAGPKFAASHTYSAPGTYSIYFGGQVTSGGCSLATPTFQFQLMPG